MENSVKRRPPDLEGGRSRILRRGESFEWPGVDLEAYKETTAAWAGVSRRELVGTGGESTAFHVRYFEVEPGGYSTLETHRHEHVVIALRGRGEARLGGSTHRLGPGDVVYVAPEDPHQFRNASDAGEPFGFLCIVDAERDRPRPVDGQATCAVCE